jgi:hypothetical protein
MSDIIFVAIILFTLVGILYWKAIQQVLLFRRTRKWTGKFVISAVWLGLVSFNMLKSVFDLIV